MSLDLYDKNGWVGIIARGQGVFDLFKPHLIATKDFLDKGEADQHHIDTMIKELARERGSLAASTLRELLQKATPPVLVTDCSGDPRSEKFDDPNQEPTGR